MIICNPIYIGTHCPHLPQWLMSWIQKFYFFAHPANEQRPKQHHEGQEVFSTSLHPPCSAARSSQEEAGRGPTGPISKETAELTGDGNLSHVAGHALLWDVIARLGGDESGGGCECSLFRMFLNHQAEGIYCSILWGPVGYHHGAQLAYDSVSKDLSLFWGGYSKPQGAMTEGRGPHTDKYLSALSHCSSTTQWLRWFSILVKGDDVTSLLDRKMKPKLPGLPLKLHLLAPPAVHTPAIPNYILFLGCSMLSLTSNWDALSNHFCLPRNFLLTIWNTAQKSIDEAFLALKKVPLPPPVRGETASLSSDASSPRSTPAPTGSAGYCHCSLPTCPDYPGQDQPLSCLFRPGTQPVLNKC